MRCVAVSAIEMISRSLAHEDLAPIVACATHDQPNEMEGSFIARQSNDLVQIGKFKCNVRKVGIGTKDMTDFQIEHFTIESSAAEDQRFQHLLSCHNFSASFLNPRFFEPVIWGIRRRRQGEIEYTKRISGEFAYAYVQFCNQAYAKSRGTK